jgi:dTDP-4-dehydrorhamnose 3,5-epimerase
MSAGAVPPGGKPPPRFEDTPIAGVKIWNPPVFTDARGDFFKTFHEELFAEAGVRFVLREQFFSTSRKGVLRGMHFQAPPSEHDKIVTCLSGSALDVVVDIRGGKDFGRAHAAMLSAENRKTLYIPAGVAHGFLALEDNTLMQYMVSSVHNPACDSGFRWDSFGFSWPVENPLVSERDRKHPGLEEWRRAAVF